MKNAEGSEAFWTEAKPGPPGRARRAGRAIQTLEPIRVPALFRWAREEDSETLDASQIPWQAPELPLDDERILVLDGHSLPPDESLGS